MAILAQLDQLGHQVQPVQQDFLALKDPKVKMDQLVLLERLDHQVLLDLLGHMVL